jgi:hypothetical protein
VVLVWSVVAGGVLSTPWSGAWVKVWCAPVRTKPSAMWCQRLAGVMKETSVW